MDFKSTKDVSSSRFLALIVGNSGVGKTSQCRHLPEDETLIISAEAGLLCLNGTNYKVAEIKSSDDLMEVYNFLTQDPPRFKYIFIDSLTEIMKILLEEKKQDPKYQDPKFVRNMYGDYGEMGLKIIKVFRDLTQYSVVFTCLDEMEKNGVEMIEQYNIPGNMINKDLKSLFDLVLHMKTYNDEEGVSKRVFLTNESASRLAKDRSGKLEVVEDANIGNIIAKVLG